jgi:hypothetical protein
VISQKQEIAMPRERREYKRRSGFRDASLVVIACEGVETEPNYFNGFKEDAHNPRMHIEVLTREEPGHSSPQHVLQRLARFTDEYRIRDGDTLWLVADRDPQSWSDEMLSAVASESRQRLCDLAISNPCFELWLLLHFEDVPNQTIERRVELQENKNGLLKSLFAAHRQPYTNDWTICKPHVQSAIQRAESLDTDPSHRWPQALGTHVYRLLKHLLSAAGSF